MLVKVQTELVYDEMYNGLPWILLLVLQTLVVITHPIENQFDINKEIGPYELQEEDKNNTSKEKIISVRITSSVAVGRQQGKQRKGLNDEPKNITNFHPSRFHAEDPRSSTTETYTSVVKNLPSEVPPDLEGANIEFIKQLYAKKGIKDTSSENIHPFQRHVQNHNKHGDLVHPMATSYLMEDSTRKFRPTSNKNNLNSTKNDGFKNLTENNQSMETNSVNKSDEILLHSSSKLIFDVFDQNAESDEDHKNLSNLNLGYEKDNQYSIDNLTNKKYNESYESDDSIAESSVTSYALNDNNENIEDPKNVPLARSVSFPRDAQNFINNIRKSTAIESEQNSQLTTVSFSIIHDNPKDVEQIKNKYVSPSQQYPEVPKIEHPKVYSEPAKVYSEPAKFYSEPSKIYSEPAKVYSEPAKIYSEPAKIYSEPAKFYSEPASLHLPKDHKIAAYENMQTPIVTNITSLVKPSSDNAKPPGIDLLLENKYEIDEKDNHQTDNRDYRIQDSSTEKCLEENCKVGYVVEGRQFKKYRVEERTSDGFIVGEYGVVRNEDGALRGVRYTADSDASPRLIYDALMKFLQLK